jgi:putative ABC transport system substrate-binding protein
VTHNGHRNEHCRTFHGDYLSGYDAASKPGGGMRRREFLRSLGTAAIWPTVAKAQRQTAVPIVGFLYGAAPDSSSDFVEAVRAGLNDGGFRVGENLKIEYRWAEGHPDRLPSLAADLVAQRAAVIIAGPTVAALAAKSVTGTTPIVFITSDNPVTLGLVQSINHPGGNITGVNLLINEIGTKRLDLLRELRPAAKRIGLLLNPASPPGAAAATELRQVAEKLSYEVRINHIQSERDIDAAFSALADWHADVVLVIPDGLVRSLRDQLASAAAEHALPTIYPLRDFVVAGGLLSYGTSTSDAFRQMGAYAGRILKGEKPADLPVVQAAKFDLVVNLRAAKKIGLAVPESLLLRADEVIE